HEPGARLHRLRAHLARLLWGLAGATLTDPARDSTDRCAGAARLFLASFGKSAVTRPHGNVLALEVAHACDARHPTRRSLCRRARPHRPRHMPTFLRDTGRKQSALDCQAEFAAPGLRLNYPAFDPAHPKPGKEVRCFDGDAGCDLDDAADHACVFDVDVCLRNSDPALPACTPADVTSVSVSGTSRDPDLAALQSALSALVPATSNVCTSGRTLTVPLKGPDAHGVFKPGKKKVSLKAATAAGTDSDSLKLRCMPRGWPSHGYDHRNTRATPNETTLSPANANALVLKWDLDLHALNPTSANGVTSTPTVGNGLVYVTSWNGMVIAARPNNGSIKWKYDTGSGITIGVQSSATLTAEGRVLVGDSRGVVHCLSATSGKLLWKSVIGDPSVDHIWASPTVVGGRVYIGIASHNDSPCTHGRLVAL